MTHRVAVALLPAGGDFRGLALSAGESDPAAPRHPGFRIFGSDPIDGAGIAMTHLSEHRRAILRAPDEIGVRKDDAGGAGDRVGIVATAGTKPARKPGKPRERCSRITGRSGRPVAMDDGVRKGDAGFSRGTCGRSRCARSTRSRWSASPSTTCRSLRAGKGPRSSKSTACAQPITSAPAVAARRARADGSRAPTTSRRWLARGHEIGCHTYSHRAVSTLSRRELAGDIDRNRAALDAICTGQRASRNFAFPYGDVSFGAKRYLERRFDSCRSGRSD